MTTAPIWVPFSAVTLFHDRQISRHGGAPGIRDLALLEMGCARPLNLHGYEPDASLLRLAAAYGYGIAKAHAFIDGNKRTAFVTAVTFLRLNGLGFRPDPVEGVQVMEGLAADLVSEAQLAAWFAKGAKSLA